MVVPASDGSLGQFGAPERSLKGVGPMVAAKVISAAADIALVLKRDGVIEDFASQAYGSAGRGLKLLVGKRWVETVAEDSVGKVEALLEEASEDITTRGREINQRVEGHPDLPIRYKAVKIGREGRILAVGHDLRATANLQQQLVGAQQSMEREYARLRHLETRYRLLFHLSSEAVLIVQAGNEKVSEANPAAAELLGADQDRLVGKPLLNLFEERSQGPVQGLLGEVRVAGRARGLKVRLSGATEDTVVSASLFRRDNTSFFLIRLCYENQQVAESTDSRLIEVLRSLPDAFVLVDSDRRVIAANRAFLDLSQLATEQQVLRVPLDEWLGRPGVDLNILMANLREHGSVRNFSTVVRGELGLVEEVEASGVSAIIGDEPCFGFMIRPISSRGKFDVGGGDELLGSVQQLTGMVGRVPLKEIIRRTTDVIESLCIEVALEVSGDNRASAAQMLGLSRQSLYSKLRRHGIGDPEDGGTEE